MQLIFDKGMDTQRAVEVDFFGENLFRGTLSASYSRILSGDATTVPDLSVLKDAPTFSSVSVVDGNMVVPLQGSYNTVQEASAAYNASTRQYSATIVLVRTETA